MSNSDWVTGKTKNQLLNDVLGTGAPGTAVNEQIKMGVFVRCTEDIEKVLSSLNTTVDSLQQTVKESADSNNKLASKVLWLNRILTAATVIYTAATIYGVLKPH
jgi:hypothetical protein